MLRLFGEEIPVLAELVSIRMHIRMCISYIHMHIYKFTDTLIFECDSIFVR